MSKREGFSLASFIAKNAKSDQATAASSSSQSERRRGNPYLTAPVVPERAIQKFLMQVRSEARRYLPKELQEFPIKKPFCEVEARLGILKVPFSNRDRRVTSSGVKRAANGALAHAFDCSQQERRCLMESGVSRSHFMRWTSVGISDVGPISQALGVEINHANSADANHQEKIKKQLKAELAEEESVETVYSGYKQDKRVCFPGHHPSSHPTVAAAIGKMESKKKLAVMDLTIPAAHYDLRVTLSSEKVTDDRVMNVPPPGWTRKRVKQRRSYMRNDQSISWQLDVTEVTTTLAAASSTEQPAPQKDYEIEVELRESVLLELINEENEQELKNKTQELAVQLWRLLSQINPLADALDVEQKLQDHPNKKAVQLALAQCGALKKFMDSGGGHYDSPIGRNAAPSASLANGNKFIGCMPVNFSRHRLEGIQRGPDNAYFLSEKTDGVRHLLVFTGDTAVLVDRAMRGKQPIPVGGDPNRDPFYPILGLIQPGTVLDGEVVMNRSGRKPRPIFIVFDVLATSTTNPILHLPFEQRLRHLRQESFRTPTANRDMFDPNDVANHSIALPLVRKNFVKRTDVGELLSHVVEERAMRIYRNGPLHNHLTDGIIFQPNLPYVCGTDYKLLKWKYLDTVTIDVEMLPLRNTDEDDALRVGCVGEKNTTVDMTRHVLLPKSERMRLEADKFESGGRVAEIGFDPETGEWYYLTMRADKVASNHISTVLGTLMELIQGLTTEELQYRLSIPAGERDTWRNKDKRGMLEEQLGFHTVDDVSKSNV